VHLLVLLVLLLLRVVVVPVSVKVRQQPAFGNASAILCRSATQVYTQHKLHGDSTV
jgi:hypothetical protein